MALNRPKISSPQNDDVLRVMKPEKVAQTPTVCLEKGSLRSLLKEVVVFINRQEIVQYQQNQQNMKEDVVDWRASSVLEQQGHMLETGLCSDCSFKVGPETGETEVFKVHKLMLARSSPVFYDMFYSPHAVMPEEIRVTDILPSTFQEMIKHIYTEQNLDDLSFKDLESLLIAADKYKVSALKIPIISAVSQYLKSSNSYIWRCFSLADKLGDAEFRNMCANVFASAANTLLDQDSCKFSTRLTQASVVAICNQEKLNLPSELVLINACVCWAKVQCKRIFNNEITGPNIRRLLMGCLPSFRFLTLSPQEFADGPGSQDWLTADEIRLFLLALCSLENREIPPGFCRLLQSRCDTQLVQTNVAKRTRYSSSKFVND